MTAGLIWEISFVQRFSTTLILAALAALTATTGADAAYFIRTPAKSGEFWFVAPVPTAARSDVVLAQPVYEALANGPVIEGVKVRYAILTADFDCPGKKWRLQSFTLFDEAFSQVAFAPVPQPKWKQIDTTEGFDEIVSLACGGLPVAANSRLVGATWQDVAKQALQTLLSR